MFTKVGALTRKAAGEDNVVGFVTKSWEPAACPKIENSKNLW